MTINRGIINLNKPEGMTSHDCVNQLRRLTNVRRIGHTGTLDPMATGVLPLCIGTSARISEYLDMDFKKYRCAMVLGLETDTLDIWGKVLSDTRDQLLSDKDALRGITLEKLREISRDFLGRISQIPPKYSALKVNGKKLYEYARAGQEVEIKSREITIKDITVNSWDPETLTATFDVTCSKGTYVRTLCVDMAEKLGFQAAMSSLVRLESGAFTLENSVTLEELKEAGEDLTRYILPTDFPLVHFGEFLIREDRAVWFITGGHISFQEGELLREPEYKDKEPPFPIREEYRKAYRMMTMKEGRKKFLGVAFYNEKYKKLVADKIFLRGLEDEDF
jgi:tRNA pseudouridine55 synthase